MRSFWFWFVTMAAAWAGSMIHIRPDAEELPWRMLLSACFFAVYFTLPLVRQRIVWLTALLSALPLLAAAAHWPAAEQALNPYPLLIFTLLAGEAVYRLPPLPAAAAGVFALLAAAAPALLGESGYPLPFLGLFAAAFAAAGALFQSVTDREQEAAARSEALLSEYRKLKRRQLSDEEAVRQEARAQAARDIHDTAGHKLTALLMQLEVYRMQASEEAKPMLEQLKLLAKESLEETRKAVKKLKKEESGGLQAILALIRRLEAENFMKIEFTVKDGALSAPLTNEQSVAVYRAVQEALTNAMRHSRARSAQVMFEAPGGGSVFRFEISNERKEGGRAFIEGFGLRSMRERVTQAGGELEIAAYEHQFIVRGSFALRKGGASE